MADDGGNVFHASRVACGEGLRACLQGAAQDTPYLPSEALDVDAGGGPDFLPHASCSESDHNGRVLHADGAPG